MPTLLTEEARVPVAHLANIPWYARRPGRDPFDPATADSSPSDWSPARVANAAARYEAGDTSTYAERGYREAVKRAGAQNKPVAEKPRLQIDKNAVMAHVALLRSSGMADEEIRLAAHLPKDTWKRAINPAVTRMAASTGTAICSIPVPSILF